MPIFAQLERASFDGIDFPVGSVDIKGGIRDVVHEYPHSPGGATEKLGRKLYTIEMKANFQATFAGYPDLWPNGLAALRGKWERQITSVLSIPTIGRIRAYAIDWSQSQEAQIRSGEMVPITFREDQSDTFLTNAVVSVDRDTFSSDLATFEVKAQEIDPKPSIFDTITDAANVVLGVKDQVDLFGNLIESKILLLTSLLDEADRTLDELQDPANHAMLDALKQLWLSSIDLGRNAVGLDRELRTFTVPKEMTVGDISQRIYGSQDRASDIMQLNGIIDPFAVEAGTTIRYYESEEEVGAFSGSVA